MSAENYKLNWKKICNIEVSYRIAFEFVYQRAYTIPCAYCNCIGCPMEVNEEGERTNWPKETKGAEKSKAVNKNELAIAHSVMLNIRWT